MAKKILLEKDKLKWKKAAHQLVNDKIDVASFMFWFVKNYPKSKSVMINNPEYQYNFR